MDARKFVAAVLAGFLSLPVFGSELANDVFNRHVRKEVEASRARGVPVAQRLAVSELSPKGGVSSAAARNKTKAEKKTAEGRPQKKHQSKRSASLNAAHSGGRHTSRKAIGRR